MRRRAAVVNHHPRLPREKGGSRASDVHLSWAPAFAGAAIMIRPTPAAKGSGTLRYCPRGPPIGMEYMIIADSTPGFFE